MGTGTGTKTERKKILVTGAAGFIGHHLARRLFKEGHYVVAVDIKSGNEYCKEETYCNAYHQLDLRREDSWGQLDDIYKDFEEVYQLAADMGGAGYIFTGENDLAVMCNSASINLNCVQYAIKWKAKVFYSSSACMYPSHNQEDSKNPNCREDSAYPANPDSEYGWEKLFSERLYLAANRNFKLQVRVARFHNIFGPEGTWNGGKEKAPAALCRKVIESYNGIVDIWGPGTQTRSFLYIDECVEGVLRLMESDFQGPVNIGSEEMISINNLARMIIDISGKDIVIRNIEGPIGVMGRNSDNTLIQEKLGWAPTQSLENGIRKTFTWIKSQIPCL
jgi:GDP-D-mannose 3', 5'-epimerase